MAETAAEILVTLVAAYLGAGALFAVPFVVWGVGRIDPAAAHGTRGFRLLILPGVVALWPLLARRWLAGRGEPPEEHNPHRDAAAHAAAGKAAR